MENLHTLITEKSKDVAVELSSLFEGLELADELKENLQVTFDTAVQAAAIQIQESVLEEATKELEEKHTQDVLEITEQIEAKYQEREEALTEATQTYIDDFLREWKEQNKLAIDNSLKAKLFDSIFESLSNVFVEHNLNVPTEQVDVYEELQQECDELQTKLDSLMKENKRLTVEAQESKVKDIIKEVTKNLTESQIEKVIALSEQIQIDENVEKKLKTIVQMVEATSKKSVKESDEENNDSEEKEEKSEEKEIVKENLNYVEPGSGKPAPSVNPQIAQYLRYSK